MEAELFKEVIVTWAAVGFPISVFIICMSDLIYPERAENWMMGVTLVGLLVWSVCVFFVILIWIWSKIQYLFF